MTERSDILTLASRIIAIAEMIRDDIASAETEDDVFVIRSHIDNTRHNLERLKERVKLLAPTEKV